MNFRLAEARDDQQIRKLMSKTVIPGHVRMIYSCEPNVFDSLCSTHDKFQIIVAEKNRQIAGMGIRSERNLNVNGQETVLGYLSGLKLSPSVRNLRTLAKGYDFFKELDSQSAVPAYLTTIIHGNEQAVKVLTSRRCGLPLYTSLGAYMTYLLPLRRKNNNRPAKSHFKIENGSNVSKDEIIKFLAKMGSSRQFFPGCGKNGHAIFILNAVGLENFIIAKDKTGIIGMAGLWNQILVKQHVVNGYSNLLNITRPWLNLGLWLAGRFPLPAPKSIVRYGTSTLMCVKNNDSVVFRSILLALMDLAVSQGLHFLTVGMHEQDPLLKTLKRFYGIVYQSELYVVSWQGDAFCQTLNKDLPPYLELGTL